MQILQTEQTHNRFFSLADTNEIKKIIKWLKVGKGLDMDHIIAEILKELQKKYLIHHKANK